MKVKNSHNIVSRIKTFLILQKLCKNFQYKIYLKNNKYNGLIENYTFTYVVIFYYHWSV